MKKNIIITIVSVLILTCLFAYARTTTTNLGLVQPIWTEGLDILTDINANSDIIDAIFDDVTLTEFGYLDGVTSALQTQLDAKPDADTDTTYTAGDFITLTGTDFDVDVKDEDAMTSDSATHLATQQSIKKYVDDNVGTATAITDGIIVEADLNADEDPTDNDILTYDTTGANFSWQTPAELSLQPLDTALTNISALAYVSASYIKLTNTDTYAVRTLSEVKTDLAYQLSDMSDVGVTTATDTYALMADGDSWESRALADGDVPNDITIDLATLATTFTATDNENEALACLLVFVDAATGAQGAETDGDITYNPSTGVLAVPSLDLTTELADAEVSNTLTASVLIPSGETAFGAHSAGFTEQVLTSGTAIAWNLGNSNKATLTAAHAFTITITASSGALNAQVIITQDGTGTRVMDEIVTQSDATIIEAEVHTDTEIIDLTVNIPTGARIRFKTSGVIPTPLVADTIYWAIRSSENHIQVATTKANAMAGTAVNISDDGTDTQTVQQLVKWTSGTLGVLSTAAGSEDILALTYKTADKQWYAILSLDFQ